MRVTAPAAVAGACTPSSRALENVPALVVPVMRAMIAPLGTKPGPSVSETGHSVVPYTSSGLTSDTLEMVTPPTPAPVSPTKPIQPVVSNGGGAGAAPKLAVMPMMRTSLSTAVIRVPSGWLNDP